MIVVDSSALLAVILLESDLEHYLRVLDQADESLISAVNYAEAHIVARLRLGERGSKELKALLESMQIIVENVDERQAKLAHETFGQYGKGNHPARLNICDCFAYALAKDYDAPLLFKGDDFRKTDIVPAL